MDHGGRHGSVLEATGSVACGRALAELGGQQPLGLLAFDCIAQGRARREHRCRGRSDRRLRGNAPVAGLCAISFPRTDARQHEIGDVRIRDQQQAGDRAEQNVERGPDIAHDFIAQRLQGGAELCVGLRILFFQGASERPQLGIRLRDRNARLQPRNSEQAVASALLRVGRAPIGSRRILGVRDVHLDRVGLDRELETFRHHADHRVRTAIQHEDAADHIIGAIEMALPKRVTENHLEAAGTAAGLLIRAGETAAQRGSDPEHVEEFPAHFLSAHALRFLFVNQRETAVAINRHARKAAVLFAEIEEIRIAHRGELGRRSGFVEIDAADGDEFVRRGKRERLQQDRVDHAEDGGVRANPEREREHGDDGEGRMFDRVGAGRSGCRSSY